VPLQTAKQQIVMLQIVTIVFAGARNPLGPSLYSHFETLKLGFLWRFGPSWDRWG
jgi:hypothetical protein